jgi:hypothetical protein
MSFVGSAQGPERLMRPQELEPPRLSPTRVLLAHWESCAFWRRACVLNEERAFAMSTDTCLVSRSAGERATPPRRSKLIGNSAISDAHVRTAKIPNAILRQAVQSTPYDHQGAAYKRIA